jgi:hypothetical protein
MTTQENKPVSIGEWIITFLILSIPVVNVIMIIVWALSESTHPSKRTYAQAIIVIVLAASALALVFGLIAFASSLAVHH